MSITQIQVCVTCKLPTDRAWKSTKHPQYGEIWNETGVCRQCWSSISMREDKKDAAEVAAQSYRGAF